VLPEVLVVVQVDGKIQVHLLNQVVLVILHQLVLHKEIQVVNQDLQVQEPQLVQVVVEQQDQVQMFVVVQTQLDQVELEHLTQ
jgi:ethanolamine transporter EutH